MEKRKIPGSISRRLSERARQGETSGSLPSLESSPLRTFFEKLAEAAQALGAGESATTEQAGQIPFNIGGKQGSVVFGYKVRMGLDGLRAEAFGDPPPQPGPAKTAAAAIKKQEPAARAPIVDVFEDSDGIRIVAELPGVTAQDCICTLQDGALHIATLGAHRYGKIIPLPAPVDPESLLHTCQNGILDVRLRRAPRP
jgi:HSP20 family protein